MNSRKSLAEKARSIERRVFAALIGTLAGTILCRLLLLVIDVGPFLLAALLVGGAWSGVLITLLIPNRSDDAVASVRTMADRFRDSCLRATLWLLGIAAILGVLSVLTGDFEVIGRVAATLGVTAIAAALLWPFTARLENDESWRAGMIGTGSVIAAYVLTAPSIWELGYRSLESSLSAGAMMLLLPAGVASAQLTHTRNARISGVVGGALYLLALISLLIAIWASDWKHSEFFLVTGFSLVGYGVLAVASLAGVGSGESVGVVRQIGRWLGVLTSTVAACCMSQQSLTGIDFDEKTHLTLASIAIFFAHSNLAFLAPLRQSQNWWRITTVVSVLVTVVASNIEIWTDPSGGLSIVGRIALAAGILASSGTLAIMILARLNRPTKGAGASAGQDGEIAIVCPFCGTSLPVCWESTAAGRSSHQTCGCGVRITMEATPPTSEPV